MKWGIACIVIGLVLTVFTSCDLVADISSNPVSDNSTVDEQELLNTYTYKITHGGSLYYANYYEYDGTTFTMRDFYWYHDGEWVKRTEERMLRTSIKPVVQELDGSGTESYYISSGILGGGQRQLRTVASWNGNSSKILQYKVANPPAIVNANLTSSRMANSPSCNFTVSVSIASGIDKLATSNNREGVAVLVLDESSTYTINVKSSGCDWWLKIGTK